MSIESNPQLPKTIDYMNQVLEVTDTHNNNLNTIVRGSDGSINNRPWPKKISIIVNGVKRVITHPNSNNESLVSKYFKKTKPSIDIDRHDKGKALCSSEAQKSTHKVNVNEQSGTSRVSGSRNDVLPLDDSPALVSFDRESKSCKVNNIPKTGPTIDCGKGVDFIDESNMQPHTSSKVSQKKMLVRSGCISPVNIEKSRKVVEKNETGSVVKEVTSGSGTVASFGGSTVVYIKDLIAEVKDSRRCKGKGVSCHFAYQEADAGRSHLSHRKRTHKEPDESDFSVDTNIWKTTHNHRKRRDIKQQKNETMKSDHKNETDIDIKQQKNETMKSDHKNETDIILLDDSPIAYSRVFDVPNAHWLGINRQTECSTLRNCGKRLKSCIDDSAGKPSTLRLKRNKNLSGPSTLNQVSVPNTEVNGNNEDSNVRVVQIEEDDVPNANELGINKQRESSTSRTCGKRYISCIHDSVGQPLTSRSKRNKNLSGPSTSNPVSVPNTQHEDSSVRALQAEADNVPNANEFINKQRACSTSRNCGKRSISLIDDSVGQTSTKRSKRNNLSGPSTSNPVSEPNGQVHANNEDSIVRALQIEADEMLARELQEQLYGVAIPEMDTSHALTMPPRRRGRPRRAEVRSRSDTHQLTRDLIIPGNINVNLAAGTMRMHNDLLQVRRDFNENDYEMLLALDEDNHKHGGLTPAQINNLPESKVQAENNPECVICLETPTVGETIRHLPCLHKFHKACIDEWLGRKTSCPVCKSSVN